MPIMVDFCPNIQHFMAQMILSKKDCCIWAFLDSCSWEGWQVYCIFLFLTAASLFGTIISQINEILVAQAEMSKELDNVLEAYSVIQPR